MKYLFYFQLLYFHFECQESGSSLLKTVFKFVSNALMRFHQCFFREFGRVPSKNDEGRLKKTLNRKVASLLDEEKSMARLKLNTDTLYERPLNTAFIDLFPNPSPIHEASDSDLFSSISISPAKEVTRRVS